MRVAVKGVPPFLLATLALLLCQSAAANPVLLGATMHWSRGIVGEQIIFTIEADYDSSTIGTNTAGTVFTDGFLCPKGPTFPAICETHRPQVQSTVNGVSRTKFTVSHLYQPLNDGASVTATFTPSQSRLPACPGVPSATCLHSNGGTQAVYSSVVPLSGGSIQRVRHSPRVALPSVVEISDSRNAAVVVPLAIGDEDGGNARPGISKASASLHGGEAGPSGVVVSSTGEVSLSTSLSPSPSGYGRYQVVIQATDPFDASVVTTAEFLVRVCPDSSAPHPATWAFAGQDWGVTAVANTSSQLHVSCRVREQCVIKLVAHHAAVAGGSAFTAASSSSVTVSPLTSSSQHTVVIPSGSSANPRQVELRPFQDVTVPPDLAAGTQVVFCLAATVQGASCYSQSLCVVVTILGNAPIVSFPPAQGHILPSCVTGSKAFTSTSYHTDMTENSTLSVDTSSVALTGRGVTVLNSSVIRTGGLVENSTVSIRLAPVISTTGSDGVLLNTVDGSLSILRDASLCFVASDNQRSVTGRGQDLTQRVCSTVRVRSPPSFVLSSSGQELTPSSSINTAVGERVTFQMVAQDPNPEDSVDISILEDPGLPPGMVVSDRICVDRGEVDALAEDTNQRVNASCSRVYKSFDWTPEALSEGRTVRICAVAHDSDSACAGVPGVPSSLGLHSPPYCVVVNVVAPRIGFKSDGVELFPELDSESMTYATLDIHKHTAPGCPFSSSLVAFDPHYSVSMAADPHAVVPPEPSVKVSIAAGAGNGTLHFAWTPLAGDVGKTVKMCASASVVDTVAGSHATRGVKGGMANVCLHVSVLRCRACVMHEAGLSSVSTEEAGPGNWIGTWLANVGSLSAADGTFDPDSIVSGTMVRLGPVYNVQKGDTLSSIAQEFSTSVKSLAYLNPDVALDSDLAIDQELCIRPCSAN